MSFTTNIYLKEDVAEKWRGLGKPSLSILVTEKIIAEAERQEARKKSEEATVKSISKLHEDVLVELEIEAQEEEKKAQELIAWEKDYLDNKEALLKQARDILDKNKGKRGFGAMEIARTLTKWRAGQKEIVGELLKGEIDAKGKM